jgi:hypothetical protein
MDSQSFVTFVATIQFVIVLVLYCICNVLYYINLALNVWWYYMKIYIFFKITITDITVLFTQYYPGSQRGYVPLIWLW